MRSTKWMGRLAGVLLVLVFVIGCAPAGGAASQSTHYVGKVSGTDAYIAIARNGAGVVAYVCDGQQVGVWFKGRANDDGSIDLTAADGSRLVASVSGGVLTGEFTPAGGEAAAFTTEVAAGEAGLYRLDETVNGEAVVGGWVVLNDGSLRGGKTSTAGFTGQTTRDSGSKWVDPDFDP